MFDGIDMVVCSFRSLRLGLWLAVDWSEPPALECDGSETQSPCYSRPVPLDPLTHTHTYYVWCVSVVGRGVCILYYVRSVCLQWYSTVCQRLTLALQLEREHDDSSD